jgi:hypothetical protein
VRRRLLVVVLAVAALAGCGDDGTPATQGQTRPADAENATPGGKPRESGGEEDQPHRVGYDASRPRGSVLAVLTSGAPLLACEELVTAEFVRSAYGSREGCEAAQGPGAVAQSLRFLSVRRGGPTATVRVVPAGGPNDGEPLTVRLVEDEGRWKVTALRSNVPVGP